MNTRQLLSAVKRRHGITSDYGLAKFLNVAKQQVSAYMDGTTLGDGVAMRVADALELDRAAVLAAMSLERAKSDDARKAWRDALKRLGGLAAGLLMMIGGGPTPPAAMASPQCVKDGAYYVKSRKRRRGARWTGPLSRNLARKLFAALSITPLVALAACAPFQAPDHAGTDDPCATLRAYGYAGNVDPARVSSSSRACKPDVR